uniref:VWFD domain-containing protein n=1 Tax=Salarias fasciatus TaxID=181472 RepID=A0A672HP22_SALFA
AAMTTIETQKYTCKTFGSGVVKPFDGSHFYVSSDCPFTFARFTLNRVECDIAIRRGPRGLLAHVEIIINKIKTVLHGGDISVEGNSVSLPYDHTYQHIFRYGIYTRLRSSLLPLSVTWHVLPGGIDTLRVELEHELSAGVAGLCGKDNLAGVMNKLSPEEEAENNCFCFKLKHNACRHFFSYTLDCLRAKTPSFIQICEQNSHSFEESPYIRCAFFKEVAEHCGNTSFVWDVWRSVTECVLPTCPGELVYVEQGAAFVPTLYSKKEASLKMVTLQLYQVQTVCKG